MSTRNGRSHNSFSERLTFLVFRRQALLGRRISQSEIGEELGKMMGREAFTQGAIQKWIAGENEPNLDTIRALARVFEVEPGWLAFGDGDPPNDPAGPEFMPPRSRDPRG